MSAPIGLGMPHEVAAAWRRALLEDLDARARLARTERERAEAGYLAALMREERKLRRDAEIGRRVSSLIKAEGCPCGWSHAQQQEIGGLAARALEEDAAS